MDVKLIFFKTNGQQKEIEIAKPVTVIGRSTECDVRIPIESCSRKQCELHLGDDSLSIKDAGSSNGTYVNNIRVDQQPLNPGDRITIGPIVLTVQINGEPADVSSEDVAAASGQLSEHEELLPSGGDDDDPFAMLSAEAEADGGASQILADSDDGGEDDPLAALEALADSKDDDKDK